MIVLYILAGLAVIISLFLILRLAQLKGGRERVEKERGKMVYGKLPSMGTVKNLSILPLIDFYSTGDDLKNGTRSFISDKKPTIPPYCWTWGIMQKRRILHPLF